MGTEYLRFNCKLILDMTIIIGRPVPHMFNESTKIQGYIFPENTIDSLHLKGCHELGILTYLGPPDCFTVDQDTDYVRKQMITNMEASGIWL